MKREATIQIIYDWFNQTDGTYISTSQVIRAIRERDEINRR